MARLFSACGTRPGTQGDRLRALSPWVPALRSRARKRVHARLDSNESAFTRVLTQKARSLGRDTHEKKATAGAPPLQVLGGMRVGEELAAERTGGRGGGRATRT